MLQTIHDKLKGIFAVAILVALGIVFVFWGVNFSTDAGGFSKAQGIEVNGREIAVEEVRRNYQEQMSRIEAAMGEAGVPDEMRKSIQQRVLDQAIQMELVRQRTAEARFRGDGCGSPRSHTVRAGVPGRRQVSLPTLTTPHCVPSA